MPPGAITNRRGGRPVLAQFHHLVPGRRIRAFLGGRGQFWGIEVEKVRGSSPWPSMDHPAFFPAGVHPEGGGEDTSGMTPLGAVAEGVRETPMVRYEGPQGPRVGWGRPRYGVLALGARSTSSGPSSPAHGNCSFSGGSPALLLSGLFPQAFPLTAATSEQGRTQRASRQGSPCGYGK